MKFIYASYISLNQYKLILQYILIYLSLTATGHMRLDVTWDSETLWISDDEIRDAQPVLYCLGIACALVSLFILY